MAGGKPHHDHGQSSEEAVRATATAAAGDVVVEELTQARPVQEEVMEEAGDADPQFDFLVDSIAVGEAFAHAMQIEELAQVDVLDLVAPRGEGPAAAVHAAAPEGPQAVTHQFPSGPPIFDDDIAGAAQANANIDQFPSGPPIFDDDVAGAAQPTANVHQVAGAVPRHFPTRPRSNLRQGQELHTSAANLQMCAAAQAQLNSFVVDRAARAIAANRQQATGPAKSGNNSQHAVAGPAPAAAGASRPSPSVAPRPQERGAGRVLSVDYASRGGASAQGLRRRPRQQQPAAGFEAITLRLEKRPGTQRATSRTVPRREAIVSARQTMLADAPHHSPGFLAGIEEEEEHGNSWYDCILREAQAMEAMDEPGLNNDDQVPYFQQQFPIFDEDPMEEEEEEPGHRVEHPCDLDDLDEAAAGPSTTTTQRTRPARVLPLADDEVPKFDCGICMETLPILDLFHGMQCQHRFCVACMATYIEGKVSAGEVPIPCPDPACPAAYGEDVAVLHPEVCKKSIDFDAFSSWGDRLTEHAIPPSLRAYCPNRQCVVLLEAAGGKTPAKAFCPVCSHPMCATCGFDWSHDDDGSSSHHDCDEGPNAELVKKLAEERRWKQCPRCKFIVEKISGCDFMRCRCKFVFCYGCGLAKGRQMRMNQSSELCRCRQQDAAVNAVLQHLVIFEEDE